jgi:AraC family transcriptional regulator
VPQSYELLPLLNHIRRRLADDMSLETLARRSGWSRFHVQRAFRRVVGETPKQYTLRLRLERAAAALAASKQSVRHVALAAGFASHEVFTRAFKRRFGSTPTHYRATALRGWSRQVRARHLALNDSIGPCIRLFHLPTQQSTRDSLMPTLSIERRELPGQPFLFIRRRISGSAESPATLADCFGKLYGYSHRLGLPLEGRPFARYVSTGPGLWTIEAGKPLAAPAPGEGEIQAGVLPAGPAAFGIHAGSYETLSETYVAIERWIEANGFHTNGAPWESYVTDPAEYPDPADWRTEVYWPIAK